MKKISLSPATATPVQDHRLTTTTPLNQFPWADSIAENYQGSAEDVIFASLMNAIYTQRKPVFLLSRRELAELVTSDSNTTVQYTGKSGISSTVYRSLLRKMSTAHWDHSTSTLVKPNFVVVKSGTKGSREADMWSLSGEYLADFFAAFPGSEGLHKAMVSAAKVVVEQDIEEDTPPTSIIGTSQTEYTEVNAMTGEYKTMMLSRQSNEVNPADQRGGVDDLRRPGDYYYHYECGLYYILEFARGDKRYVREAMPSELAAIQTESKNVVN